MVTKRRQAAAGQSGAGPPHSKEAHLALEAVEEMKNSLAVGDSSGDQNTREEVIAKVAKAALQGGASAARFSRVHGFLF